MHVRHHTPPSFRSWVRQTALYLLLFAVVPSLLFAAAVARTVTAPSALDVNASPKIVLNTHP